MYNNVYDDDDDEYADYCRQQSRYEEDNYLDNTGNSRQSLGSDHDSEPTRESSQYNDGQGIEYVISFQPQLPPLQPNERHRKNARAPVVKCSIYAHEESSLVEVLDAAIAAIGRNESTMSFKIVGQQLRTSRFTVTWTIARTDYSKMQLTSEAQFKEMVAKVVDRPRVVVALEITESVLESGTVSGSGETANDLENGPEKGPKKRKLTDDEEAMAETINQLQAATHCADHVCTSRHCFVGNAKAKHVRLTPLLFHIWAAAILAKTPGVDLKTPPPPEEEKGFWPPEDQPDDIDDISLFASRRRASSSKPSSAVTINNDFAGLATILTLLLSSSHRTPVAVMTPSTPTPHRPPPPIFSPASPARPAKMTILEFCAAFRLSDQIRDCLLPLELDGPHVLKFIKDEELNQYLTLGQRTSLRYAESKWAEGKTSD
ncbi:hypothetical protein MSAN_00756600 [Mycena sanguinolenta]|uniref:Uncharacterized protein n=1 Tax=Mycena sanguinolenta TaxID=230812 RepID=A0A8H6Z8L7_9AGAR|nr:hypothetical protein MSAN_00756600 [Mycena sanguinolenta]